ncbi:MAG TPA: hypothetical protein DHW64_12310 [Chitinophagaceae bacterium]|jgi:membrane fusion protein, peptide pheromone/bacteriocin exporter|nr:hypothetical protein [Chitinophagaceae bacterium]
MYYSSLPTYRTRSNKKSSAVYLTILVLASSAIICLPFIKTTVAIKSRGIIRPQMERTEIKPVQGGLIDSLLVKEGDMVLKGQLIAVILDRSSSPQLLLNEYEYKQRQAFILDLQKLTGSNKITVSQLQTPFYRQQLNRFLFQSADQEAGIKKVKKELEITNTLLAGKVIAPKESFDKEIEAEKLIAVFDAFQHDQKTNWLSDLQRYQLELSQLLLQRQQLEVTKRQYKIYATVSGIVQLIQHRYPGGYIQPGETICIISPQTTLIAECQINTHDIGLLHKNQPVRFQIDAFDYNYFGILTGKIIAIDNDFNLIDNKPFFKVRCSFDNNQLLLKNGYKADLKKGLTLQARFIVAERTLWQLLFDRIDDWFNPAAPTSTQSLP